MHNTMAALLSNKVCKCCLYLDTVLQTPTILEMFIINLQQNVTNEKLTKCVIQALQVFLRLKTLGCEDV